MGFIPDSEEEQAVMEHVDRFKICNNSKHILKYIDHYVEYGCCVMILEFLPISILEVLDLIKQTIPEQAMKIIIKQALLALQYLDGESIEMDCLRASEIYVSRDGDVKLSNLKLNEEPWMNDGYKFSQSFGPIYWTSPEGNGYSLSDMKSIVYSVGCAAIEMATGEPPFGKISPWRILTKKSQMDTPSLPMGGDWTMEFKDFVNTCMRKNPKERPTFEELLNHKWTKEAKCNVVLREWVQDIIPLVEKKREELRVIEDEEIAAEKLRKKSEDGYGAMICNGTMYMPDDDDYEPYEANDYDPYGMNDNENEIDDLYGGYGYFETQNNN